MELKQLHALLIEEISTIRNRLSVIEKLIDSTLLEKHPLNLLLEVKTDNVDTIDYNIVVDSNTRKQLLEELSNVIERYDEEQIIFVNNPIVYFNTNTKTIVEDITIENLEKLGNSILIGTYSTYIIDYENKDVFLENISSKYGKVIIYPFVKMLDDQILTKSDLLNTPSNDVSNGIVLFRNVPLFKINSTIDDSKLFKYPTDYDKYLEQIKNDDKESNRLLIRVFDKFEESKLNEIVESTPF